jgi:uncharacterized protein (DUF2141 family)
VKTLLFFWAALLFVAGCRAANLTVEVGNIDPKGGELHVALYTQETWPDDAATPVADRIVPAVAPVTTVSFEGLKPGVYGVKSYQDVNRNDKFDQNWFGLPLERYGFSRDAKPILTEPGFSRTKFTLPEGDLKIVIHLQ